ncbi:MAG: DMT family transporter, partial [bacterium]|nr:DMT family transporter [bacterium]
MIGEIAGLTTAVVWAFTSLFFTFAARRVGALTVNRLRLLIASVLLMITHWIFYGKLLPIDAEIYRWLWLMLSGFIGLVIGDSFLFQGFVMVGTRITMLLLSLVPIISSLLAWLFLGEVLGGLEIVAVVLTISGIAWVVSEKDGAKTPSENLLYIKGVMFGIGGAVGQAFALITAKKAFGGDF